MNEEELRKLIARAKEYFEDAVEFKTETDIDAVLISNLANALEACLSESAARVPSEILDKIVSKHWRPCRHLNSDQNDAARSEYRESVRSVLETAFVRWSYND